MPLAHAVSDCILTHASCFSTGKMVRTPKKGEALQKHKRSQSLTTVINNKNEERFVSLAAKNNLRLSNMVSFRCSDAQLAEWMRNHVAVRYICPTSVISPACLFKCCQMSHGLLRMQVRSKESKEGDGK